MRAWKAGHRGACQWLAEQKAEVQAVTGDPREWGRFTRWLEFHHASLVNATIAYFLREKDKNPNVASDHLLHISFLYRNDPARPPREQFEMRGAHLVQKNSPGCGDLYERRSLHRA